MKKIIIFLLCLTMIIIQPVYASNTCYFETDETGTKYFYDREGSLFHNSSSLKIMDVCSWQGQPDWEKVKESDVDGVIIRAMHGDYIDPYFSYNISECNRLGIPYGIYYYSTAYDYDSAKQEADWLNELLSTVDLNLTMPIWYDIEKFTSYTSNGISISAPTTVLEYETIISSFIDAMNDYGYEGKVQIYSYEWYLTHLLNSPSILPYTTWAANYGGKLNWNNPYVSEYYGWQYDATQTFEGMESTIDYSAFPGDYFENCFNIVSSVNEHLPSCSIEPYQYNDDETVTLSGYVYDLDDIRLSETINIYVNDSLITAVTANQNSNDYNKENRISGRHAFSTTFSVSEGDKITIKVVDPQTNMEYEVDNTTYNTYKSNYDPVGTLDNLTASVGSVTVEGWAFDQDSTSISTLVKVYIGNTCLGTIQANDVRNDINETYTVTGNHGYQGTLSTSLKGNQTVTVKAVDLQTNKEFVIGSKEIYIPVTTYYTPVGCVDSVNAYFGKVTVGGWAFDKDDDQQSLAIKVYADEICLGTINADSIREDVNIAYGISGSHGFNDTITTTLTGSHTITLKAVDLMTSQEITIGYQTVNFPAYATNYQPVGELNSVTESEGKITVTGWTYDEDSMNTSISVKVYAGNLCLGTLKANQNSKEYGITGKHAYSGTLSTSLKGNQKITIKAIDLESKKEYVIGSKNVYIPSYTADYQPIGCLDSVTPAIGKITIGGWALDQDDTGLNVEVKVYIGSICLGTLTTDQDRKDVNAAYGVSGEHGFYGTFTTALTGKQTIILKVVDLFTDREYVIGSQSVTIPTYPTKYKPVGSVDFVNATKGKITVGGWAFDQDGCETSTKVKVYIGSICLGTLTANQERNDVNNAFEITGKHGYSGTLTTTLTGKKTVIIKAVDLTTKKEYIIGIKTVVIPTFNKFTSISTDYDPVGCTDIVRSLSSGKIYIAGWAFDPDCSDSNVVIRVYAASKLIGSAKTDFIRKDVNSVYGISGSHGFNIICSTTLRGEQNITIKVLDLKTCKEYTIKTTTIIVK